jgi:dethiobiotin synthetase
MKPLFITAIGTDIGKTIISAITIESLKADYWKPVQCGDLQYSDTEKVKNLISNTESVFHPEAYRLTQPFSPHKAADLDHTRVELEKIIIPRSSNRLIIEGAGGLMVPLNETSMVIDLIKKLDAEVILVSKNYLGSINHTLLSLLALQANNISIRAIIFNGYRDDYTENVILKYSGISSVARIPFIEVLNKESIKRAGASIEALNL